MKNIILASGSPRRTEILNLAKIKHTVVVLEHEEKIDLAKKPVEIVKELAFQKANAVFEKYQDSIVIGADTIVVQDEILGKPKDRADAYRMLKKLSKKTHQVITGVSVISSEKVERFAEVTNVTFKEMTDEEIYEYIDSENVLDKAGAYAIQGMASKYISKIEGDYYNVVGLPISRLSSVLKTFDKNVKTNNEIVIIGGSNIDYIGNLPNNFNISESNVGSVNLYFGGVARNISENIARNGIKHSFVTCIGNDFLGKAMKEELESIGVDLYIPDDVSKTGSFLSLNENNNLYVGICDTDYTDTLTIEYLDSINVINDNTKYIILDSNIPEKLIDYVCNKYSDKYIIADGISSKKVVKFKPYLDKLSLLKVNVYEGKALTKEESPELILKELRKMGLQTAIITRGYEPTLYNMDEKLYLEPIIKVDKVVNTTGAGDAMLSGTIVGIVRGYDFKDAIKLGHKFANLNVQVETPTVKN